MVGSITFTLAGFRLSSMYFLTFFITVFFHAKTSCFSSLVGSESSGFAIIVFPVKIDHRKSVIHSYCFSSIFWSKHERTNLKSSGLLRGSGNWAFIVSSINLIDIWCIENPYKRMDMWTTPILKFNTYSLIFCFTQWFFNYDIFENLLQLYN